MTLSCLFVKDKIQIYSTNPWANLMLYNLFNVFKEFQWQSLSDFNANFVERYLRRYVNKEIKVIISSWDNRCFESVLLKHNLSFPRNDINFRCPCQLRVVKHVKKRLKSIKILKASGELVILTDCESQLILK